VREPVPCRNLGNGLAVAQALFQFTPHRIQAPGFEIARRRLLKFSAEQPL